MHCYSNRMALNCDKRMFNGDGYFECPPILPIDMDITDAKLIGFNYVHVEKEPQNKIIHFYLDDYQFDRVWNSPDNYIDVLRKYKAVLSPDFSMYADFPRAVSLFNHYRKQWCGAYWQEHGINVIPTVGWTREDSYEYCFDGLPRNSLVCISTLGMFFNKEHREKFMRGYEVALGVLKPKKILFYGKLFPEIYVPEGIEYSVAVNAQVQRFEEIRNKRRAEAKANRKEKK